MNIVTIIVGIIVGLIGISIMTYVLNGRRACDTPAYAIGLCILVIGIGITAEGISPGLIVDFFKSTFMR